MKKNGTLLIEALKEAYGAKNNADLAKKMDVQAPKIHSWQSTNLSKTILRNVMKTILSKERNRLGGDAFVDYGRKIRKSIKDKPSDKDLAEYLGVTAAAVVGWRKKGLTIPTIYNVIKKANDGHTRSLINPIIEFYQVDRTVIKNKYEVIGKKKPAVSGLKEELDRCYGVYVFFDSRGHAVYVGKAEKQSLWKEINSAYNRERGDNQVVKKVVHPKKYNIEKDKKRNIVVNKVYLHDICVYFSAYSVEKKFISNLEAALTRMFPNDLLNSNVEKFRTEKPKRVAKNKR